MTALSTGCRSFLSQAANKIDCAVQQCGDPDVAKELDEMERRLDELAKDGLRVPR